ncbi:MAG: hypothetical protein O6931_07385 [Gammaproteobacteria bacterium]|nr:hypothetical protein [Gammaproteobacteria bacterium]
MTAGKIKLSIVVLMLPFAGACVQQEIIKANPTPLKTASQDFPDTAVLDIGVAIFDPGIADDLAVREEKEEKRNIFPEVRKAEARYMAYQMKRVLEDSGAWGAVRVLPKASSGSDLMVFGEILSSDGEILKLRIKAVDAAGHKWLDKKYEDRASKYAYKDYVPSRGDPFLDLYNSIANDLLAVRQQMTVRDLENIRRVAELRFAGELSPEVFGDYLEQNKGQYEVRRLPSVEDPMVARMMRIRQREYMYVDTLDQYYATLYRQMDQPYADWRKFTFEEAIALRELRAAARNRKLMGALMVIGGIVVDSKSDTQAARIAGASGVIGGVAVFKSGMDRSKESQLHFEAMKELGESMEAQVAPMVVEVEGQTVELTGTVDAQFDEWKVILRDIYAADTGIIMEEQDAALNAGSIRP